MLQIMVNVNTSSANALIVKESLAMYLERFGDCRVVEVKELPPKDWAKEQQRMY